MSKYYRLCAKVKSQVTGRESWLKIGWGTAVNDAINITIEAVPLNFNGDCRLFPAERGEEK